MSSRALSSTSLAGGTPGPGDLVLRDAAPITLHPGPGFFADSTDLTIQGSNMTSAETIHNNYHFHFSPNTPSISQSPASSTPLGYHSAANNESVPAALRAGLMQQTFLAPEVGLRTSAQQILVAQEAECNLATTYARILADGSLGYPLWTPGPNTSPHVPEAHRRLGTTIGDVGRITSEGSFDFFFNTFAAADDTLNNFGVPDNFVPYSGADEWPSKRNVNANSFTTASVRVEHSRSGGPKKQSKLLRRSSSSSTPSEIFDLTVFRNPSAGCILPGVAKTTNVQDLDKLGAYLLQTALSWASDPRLKNSIARRTLHLVTGVTQTTQWGNFVLKELLNNAPEQLTYRSADANSFYWSNQANARCQTRSIEEDEYFLEANQTVFLTAFRIEFLGPWGGETDDGVIPGPRLRRVPGTGYLAARDLNSSGPRQAGSRARTGNNLDEREGNTSPEVLASSMSSNSPSTPPCPTAVWMVRPEVHLREEIFSSAKSSIHAGAAAAGGQNAKFPNAKAIITHDSYWMAALEPEDKGLPAADTLLERMLSRLQPTDENGVVVLRPRAGIGRKSRTEMLEGVSGRLRDSQKAAQAGQGNEVSYSRQRYSSLEGDPTLVSRAPPPTRNSTMGFCNS
ncbi:hypothetical protein MKEN_00860700 [Mycena kentingensis (nom. inval.)]|nr:hypothetical protein MKEN_00860700 [Mycena kentingensis (nom. inval.)]